MSAMVYSLIYQYWVINMLKKVKNKHKIQKELDLHGLLS